MSYSSAFSRFNIKVVLPIAILIGCILATAWMAGLESFLPFISSAWKPQALPVSHSTLASLLPGLALEKFLEDAAPIFGFYSNVQSETSTWMSGYADETRLVHMNIPGAHDAATWNYTVATQQSLKHVTGLISDTMHSPDWFRCQQTSIIDMLNAGIRAFDLRYAQDVTHSTLVFWHGPALQSQTATVDDVMFGFYQWLEDHPSEMLFLSFQYEANSMMGNVDSADVQLWLYSILTSAAAQQFVLQAQDTVGTLGSARGKIILLRRFDLDLLSPSYDATISGIHFTPQDWTVNSPEITLVYNSAAQPDNGEEGKAYIEDYYSPLTLPSSTLAENVDVKVNAIRMHLLKAASNEHPDGLFWTFSSATNVRNELPITPRLMALGDDGDAESKGVNQDLVEFFHGMDGKRLGIVMFDFYDEPAGLIPAFLDLNKP